MAKKKKDGKTAKPTLEKEAEKKVMPKKETQKTPIVVETQKEIAQAVETVESNPAFMLREKIPSFELPRMLEDANSFFKELETAASDETREATQKSKRPIFLTLTHLEMGTEELKSQKTPLTDDEKKVAEEVKKGLPEDLLKKARSQWLNHLEAMVKLLEQFHRDGLKMIGTIKPSTDTEEVKSFFFINESFLQKMIDFLRMAVKSQKLMNLENYIDPNFRDPHNTLKKKKRERMVTITIGGKEKKANIDEDTADQEIDRTYYEEIIKEMKRIAALPEKTEAAIENLRKKIIFAMHVNFLHLKNSIAGQRLNFLILFKEDMEEPPFKENPQTYYLSTNSRRLFESEGDALNSLLQLLDKCLHGVIASERLADLLH